METPLTTWGRVELVDTNSFAGFVARWAGVVLVFDVAASLTSLGTGLPYGWFTIGSVVIYLATGYMGAPRFGVRSAVVATVLVALVDATLGWAVSWFIGPGQPQDSGASTSALLISGAIGALIFGGITGLLGGWIAVRRQQ